MPQYLLLLLLHLVRDDEEEAGVSTRLNHSGLNIRAMIYDTIVPLRPAERHVGFVSQLVTLSAVFAR